MLAELAGTGVGHVERVRGEGLAAGVTVRTVSVALLIVRVPAGLAFV
jgi:hypothetical protein